MTRVQLTGSERDLLRLVSDAICANPFGPERESVDRRMAGPCLDAQSLPAALKKLDDLLASLKRRNLTPHRFSNEADAGLLRYAGQFSVFHRFCDPLDELIRRQAELGEATCPAPFARDALARLASWDLQPAQAARVLGLFFQLRRAYYFISGALVGNCPSMCDLRCRLWANVFTTDMRLYDRHLCHRMEDFSTLLIGDTGTGKGAAAAAIGQSGFIPFDEKRMCFSESFTRSFVTINLSQYPEALIESELFGHRKGAFTGAVESHEGVFARCSPCGAIFIDEIGDVSIPVQIKLLKVLQERTFSPVGSHAIHRFNGRVIAASNRSIEEQRRKGLFRDDFFYRLCSDVIRVPPLRVRIEEDPGELDLLTDLIVKRILGDPSPDVSNRVRACILRDLGPDYGWPGNVRELEQRVRQVLLRGACPPEAQSPAGMVEQITEGIGTEGLSAAQLTADYCSLLYQRHGRYEHVGRLTGLDRRTVKKYILESQSRRGTIRPENAG